MKKLSMVNVIGALAVFMMVWLPPTRVFLTDMELGTPITIILSLLLSTSAIGTYQKYQQKIDIVSLFISLSPIIFIALVLIIALLGELFTL